MSRAVARRALSQLVGRPAYMAPDYLQTESGDDAAIIAGSRLMGDSGLLADMRELAAAPTGQEQLQAAWEERRHTLAMDYYGTSISVADKPFAFHNGIAIIPIHGTLINRYNWSWSYGTGYNFIRSQIAAASEDEDVTQIILDVNSFGGMVAGCQETADAIRAASAREGGKPILAVVDAYCFSAAYYLSSQADRIAVTPSGMAGSIGVVLMHTDLSKALEDYGVKITFIVAGDRKVDGNPFEPLGEAARKKFQADVDASYSSFVSYVAEGRKNMSEEDVRATQAQCYRADEALSLKLVDSVQNPTIAIQTFCDGEVEQDELDDDDDEDPPTTETEESDMAVKPNETAGGAQPSAEDHAAAVASASAIAADAARSAERARVQGITGHAEAEGRGKLAAHLAFHTSMSVEEAAAMLAVAAKETAAAPPPPAAEGQEGTAAFKAAMARSQHPNIEAGAGEGDGTGEPTADRGLGIIAAYTGVVGDTKH